MKRLPLLLLLLLSACNLIEMPMSMGSSRGRSTHRNPVCADGQQGSDEQDAPDTIIYMTAVSYPEDYFWVKDTATASNDAEIVLYRNFEPVLSVPTGPGVSADADRHHVVDGHLITQGEHAGRLLIGKDGQILFSFGGAGELRGIVFREGHSYTLVSYPEGGFCYRRDADTLLFRSEGKVYGSLSDPSYPLTGALYEDLGSLVFCYAAKSEEGWTHYRVVNGKEKEAAQSASAALDFKIVDGSEYMAKVVMNAYNWNADTRVWRTISHPLICGGARNYSSSEWRAKALHTYDYALSELGPSGGDIYVGAEGELANVVYARDGQVSVFVSGALLYAPQGRFRYISPLCACLCGNTPVLALRPMDDGQQPSVLIGGRALSLDIFGFVSSISATINDR